MEYWKMVNGALIQVHDFDDALESIRISYQSKVDEVNRLSEENERLRDEVYKDNELAAIKKNYLIQRKDSKNRWKIIIGDFLFR